LDTDRDNLDQLESLLASEGLRTEGFVDSRDFLGHYTRDCAGCLVIDLDVAGINGLDLQRQLASLGLQPQIVFMAEGADVTRAVAAMRRGAVDFLEKPLLQRQVVKSVGEALERDRQARSQRELKATVMRRIETLTNRERETMDVLLDGMNTKQIAAAFGIGLQTVAKHRARLLHKLDVRSDAQLVRLCLTAGIELPVSRPSSPRRFPEPKMQRPATPPPHFVRPNLNSALVEH
jgi:two-component system response regulator TtrR